MPFASSFVDSDVAAATALGEMQDGVGHDMFNDDGSLNASGVESTAEGSVAAAGDSSHMPESLALTQPPKSDAGAFAGHAPGQPFATPLESGRRSEVTAVTPAGAGDAMFPPRTNEDTAVAQHTGGVAGPAPGLLP